MIEYHIVEIFESLQGEGYNTGMPAIFIRFGGCDLRCKWCDTNFNQYQKMTLNEILERIKNYSSKNIIITGGEPTLQKKLPVLLEQLKAYGYFIAIESNGLHPFSKLIDYIAISPKFAYQDKYQTIQNKADEVRIVVESDKDFYDFCMEMENKIVAKRYYLSPCEISGKYNFLETIQLLGKINQNRRSNKWMLNIQTHKLCNIE